MYIVYKEKYIEGKAFNYFKFRYQFKTFKNKKF